MYTSAFTFGFPAAAPLITAPPYEWATTTTGPVWASIKRLVVSTSFGSEVNGFCTATTLYPSCCNCVITVCQPEASANAPCTSTMVGLAAVVRAAWTVAACAIKLVGCSASGAAQPTSTASTAIFTASLVTIVPIRTLLEEVDLRERRSILRAMVASVGHPSRIPSQDRVGQAGNLGRVGELPWHRAAQVGIGVDPEVERVCPSRARSVGTRGRPDGCVLRSDVAPVSSARSDAPLFRSRRPGHSRVQLCASACVCETCRSIRRSGTSHRRTP